MEIPTLIYIVSIYANRKFTFLLICESPSILINNHCVISPRIGCYTCKVENKSTLIYSCERILSKGEIVILESWESKLWKTGSLFVLPNLFQINHWIEVRCQWADSYIYSMILCNSRCRCSIHLKNHRFYKFSRSLE